jgi:hypothetical protein
LTAILDLATLCQPGPSSAAANRQAIVRALAAPWTSPDGVTSTSRLLRFPPYRIFIDRPIRLPKGCELTGEGRKWSTLAAEYESWPLLVNLTMDPIDPTTGQPRPLSPDHFLALDAKGDGSFSGRNGWRGKGDSFLAVPGSPFSLGPPGGWSQVSHLVIEFAVLFNDPAAASGPLFGVSAKNGLTWTVGINQQYINVWLALEDGTPVNGWFPRSSGYHSVEIDLKAGTMLGVSSGIQQPVTHGSNWSAFAAGGLSFNVPDMAEGVIGLDCIANAEASAGQILDFTVLGLRLGTSPVYTDQGPGNPAKRIDGQPVVEARCFDEGAGLLWLLRNNDSLSDLAGDGCISTRPYNGYALALQPANAAVANSSQEDMLRDLTVTGGYEIPGGAGHYGGAMLLGPVLDFELDHVAWRGDVKSLFPTASYKTRISACKAASGNVPLSLWGHMAHVSDIKLDECGPKALEFRWCGEVHLHDVFAGNGSPRYVVDILGGDDPTFATLSHIAADYEGGAYPSHAAVRQLNNAGSTGSTLKAETVWVGIAPSGMKLFELLSQNRGPAWTPPPATFEVSHSCVQAGLSGPYLSADASWAGTVMVNGFVAKPMIAGAGCGQVNVDRVGTPIMLQVVTQ